MLELRVESAFDPISIQLVEALWREEVQLYGNSGPCKFRPDEIAGPLSRFLVAVLSGEAVGCGAIRPLADGVAEIKRMFVIPRARRQGIGRQLIDELVQQARELKYHTVRLETGVRQPEAIALYEGAGFTRIPCWGEFANDPVSICFEKQIASMGEKQ